MNENESETRTKKPAPVKTGPAIIKALVHTLPASPGVYRMLDRVGQVIYVGKARNLKARVANYTRLEGNPLRTKRMISATAAMEFVRTNSESEALLLEANMIKRLKPRYNVLLRDDKSFPYILIATDHEAPQLLKHRGTRRRKGYYFGPFASPSAVERTITALQKVFLLRNCSNSYYSGRSRPCLQFQIKRCAAPCTGEISPPDYLKLVENARAFLAGKSKSIQTRLSQEMDQAAQELEFERAALLRDRLSALSVVQTQGDMTSKTVEQADIFAIRREADRFCVQVFFYRAFQNWGNHAFYPQADPTLSENEVLAPFLTQFYQNRTPANQILISHQLAEHELIALALSEKSGHRIKITLPKRGEKLEMVNNAVLNAKEALGRLLAETASQKKLLQGVAKTFDLNDTPRRIEVYDNSHISGTNAIGAMIVAGPQGFAKKHYRTFNIKSDDLTPGDDFAMMREVLTRRFLRLAREHPDPQPEKEDVLEPEDNMAIPDWPDLLLIDGGKGQLSAVRDVLKEINLPRQIKLVGIAKGEERDAGRESFHMVGKKPFMLAARDPVLYYLQRLRDEAHRFAIGTHRARRKKNFVKNPLDEIEGIGPTRKKALLNQFGSAKAVSRAALADLIVVPGISSTMAQLIFDHFNRSD
ncbi:Excinuclease ABC subunit C [hydrothermal vent metagenome]|uniref:Excinuclease ABC subunit C n=1 Tax=hydrothermal vent metagenome TaxID=652676 RepID=A0A3B0TCK7_9ZZZZ